MGASLKILAPAIFAVALSACTGGSPNVPGMQMPPGAEAQVAEGSFAVCAAAAPGTARCHVLVRRGAHSQAGPTGYGPADLQAAYNLPSATKGTGQVVAIVDAYDNPNAASDLATYRSTFGLAPATFTKYNQLGQTHGYPAASTSWGVEIDLDLEMVSASCPNCTLYLVEANSGKSSDLQAAEAEAVTLGAHIVSNSFGGVDLNQSYFDTKGVTYLGAAGSNGSHVSEPAAFGSVVSVGGTSLKQASGQKRGWTESAWGGGGCTNFPKPPWQHDSTCAFRLANDVSAVADPSTGVAEFDSFGYGGWFVVGGTSVPTPLLAGVFGLAGNATKQDGGRTFWQPAHHKFLYRVKSSGKARYSTAAGWGSPDGTGAF